MANKNHALDSQIDQAALREFLAAGYEKASLRKIAAAAGVTVGAIYTRYSTKDQLFCSLVQPLVDRVSSAFSSIKEDYYEGARKPHYELLAASMQKESDTILHLLFDDYERAVLLLCRSAGSSMEHFLDAVVQRKLQETTAFFEQSGEAHPDTDVLRLLTTSQFHMYAQIIDGGYDLEAAKRMMHAAMVYHTGGWLTLLGLSQEKN